MKKIFLVVIVGIFLLSSVQAINFSKIEDTNEKFLVESFSFPEPRIVESEDYITIELFENTFLLRDTGKPELPIVTFTFDTPFGAKNIDIKFTPSVEYEMELTKKIKPSPDVVTIGVKNEKSTPIIESNEIYSSKTIYPSTWFSTKVTCGLKSYKERVTHIIVYVYPVRYSPALDKIYYIKDAEVKITYDQPRKTVDYQEEYDLVIIAPNKFSDELQRLVNHKNSQGIDTFLKTTEEIYNKYSGVDKPEQIKYFIKDAIETNNVGHVLLIGGLNNIFYAKDRDHRNYGEKYWHVPVRYTNIVKSGSLNDKGAISDLYYADVYKGGGEFEDWDSNGDGIIARWSNSPDRDTLDFNPDVYVGRYPCRNLYQLKTVVNKIINYETTTPNSDAWYRRMVGISGLSFELYNGQPDGEYLTDLALDYMDPVIDEEVRVYASNANTSGPIPEVKDVTKTITKGARYVYFSGHGNPLVWVTHPVDNPDVWMERISTKHLWRCLNFKKLPIIVVGGCHDAQFNITLWTTYKSVDLGDDHWYWTHGTPGASCFCWKLITIPWGGAIATVGGTGLTTSWVGQPNSLNGELATNIFYKIGQDVAISFGEAFYGSIQKFIDEHSIGLTEAHAITIWNYLGDPSLSTL
jgi:hypothetical protein